MIKSLLQIKNNQEIDQTHNLVKNHIWIGIEYKETLITKLWVLRVLNLLLYNDQISLWISNNQEAYQTHELVTEEPETELRKKETVIIYKSFYF